MKPWDNIFLLLQRLNATFGQNLAFQCIQDSIVSELIIGVEGTISTAAATAAIEGLPAIISKVSVGGTLTGYQPLNPINNMTGPMLAESAQFIRSNVSYSFGSLGSTGNFGVYIPCTFVHPRLPGQWRYMSCLPAKWMGNLTLNVNVATQAQMDTNATPTLAFSALSVVIQQDEYKVSSIPSSLAPLVPAGQLPTDSFQFIPTTLNYSQNLNPQAGQQQQQLFPNGTYLLFLIRSFNSTNASTRAGTVRQADGTAGPIDMSITSIGLNLQDVNQSPKEAVTWNTIRFENLNNITDSLVPGNAALQFNRGLSDIFQPLVGPNQVPLLYPVNLAGTSNSRIDFVYMQLFDAMNWLQLV